MGIIPCTHKLRPLPWAAPLVAILLLLLLLLQSPSFFPASTLQTVVDAAALDPLLPWNINETDRLSLHAFKDGIVSDPRGALTSWNGSVHHCQWQGIVCSHRHPGRVVALLLSSLGLVGYISPAISNLTFLRTVDLSDNHLYGVIRPEIGFLSRLRDLNLSINLLSGEIPSNVSRCASLRAILLTENQLVGEIPEALANLPRLSVLALALNHITGVIPPSLGNLSSSAFTALYLSGNMLTGGIPTELGHLTRLRFFGVQINRLSGTVPPSLYNLSSIETFAISDNSLSGTLPSDLGVTMPNLTFLSMAQNQFNGAIPNSLSNASSLQILEFLHNDFSGTIPDNLGTLKKLDTFHVAFNMLQAKQPKDWNFLTALTNCTRLRVIFLGFNELQGELPNSVANFSSTLETLAMGGNQISGGIPIGLGNLRGLTGLGMGGNRLTGTIPSALGKLNHLVLLELADNQLSSEIPSELSNLTQLSLLYLQNNNLVGYIPKTFGWCQQLQKLDMSSNRLSGTIPDELFTLFTMVELNFSTNFLEGSIPSNIQHLINLRVLDLSVNRLSEYLPTMLGDCLAMEVLDLHSNSFNGTIPPSLGNLKGITAMDLSVNNLTGKIPGFLEDFKFLRYLNLSFNNFIGEVPHKGVFANASAISLFGNTMICGGISALGLPTCASQIQKKTNGSRSLKVIVSAGVVGVCFFLSLCFLTYLYWIRKSKGMTSVTSPYEVKYKKISYHDLVKATEGFAHENLLGQGSFGSVYKGVLDDENIVAVKVLNIQRRGALKTFKSECEALRNIRHRNLVRIISVCSSIDFSGNDFKAVVFEFFPNGSLEKWLHPEQQEEMRTLDFAQRLCIAVDIASALDYLHNHCHSPIVHCDLKPSNVLLDCDMTAHVGDFGLARFIPMAPSSENLENQSSTLGIKGSIGYVAPEYGLGSPVSIYGDIYSFGIILLELFTAKRPIDDMFKDGLSLQKFVQTALLEQTIDVIDPLLIPLSCELEQLQDVQNRSWLSREKMTEYIISVMRIGLNCTKESPRERMLMGAVLEEIHHIQETYLKAARSTAS